MAILSTSASVPVSTTTSTRSTLSSTSPRRKLRSAATARKKLRRCIVHVEDGDGFCQVGLGPFKPVECFIKPLAAMATLPYKIINGKSSIGKSDADVMLPATDSPYVASRKRGKRRRRASRRVKKRRRRRKIKVGKAFFPTLVKVRRLHVAFRLICLDFKSGKNLPLS